MIGFFAKLYPLGDFVSVNVYVPAFNPLKTNLPFLLPTVVVRNLSLLFPLTSTLVPLTRIEIISPFAAAKVNSAPSKPSASADLSPFLVRSIPYVYTFFSLGVASVVSPGLFWYVILALFSFIYTAFLLTCA